MRDFGESPLILFVTTVLSHVTMLPTLHFLYRRRYTFELCVVCFALISSFMYHTCESFDVVILLTEKQWHRLDNVGIITMMGVWYTYFSSFPSPMVEMTCKYSAVFVAVISQQQHPWDVRFTVTPILLFGLQPVVQHCLINRRLPRLHRRPFALSLLWVLLAIPFFVVGLDDAHDPYRVFHGMWHFCGGLAMMYGWMTVANPTITPVPAPPKSEAESALPATDTSEQPIESDHHATNDGGGEEEAWPLCPASTRLCAVASLLLLALCACAVSASPLLLVGEVSKEQVFLQHRRGLLAPDAFSAVTRGLPSTPRPALPADALMALTPRALNQLLAERQVTCDGCVEKRELAERALAVQHLATRDERLAQTLTLREDTPLSPAELQTSHVTATEASLGMTCAMDTVNATIVCGPRDHSGLLVM